ncbi:MAP7 domain-containing protein 1 isoform X20 [Bombyx mori]|uniref:MAP7 domain-containing protein 1 isoform X20 n=1 Tax=Bombyx mori TaxID=7091 RepID=UPI002ED3C1EA
MEVFEGKRQSQHQQSAKSSRSPSPESVTPSASNEVFQPIQRTPTPNRVGPPPSPPVPTQPIVPVAPEPSGPLPLMPCLVCGRTFVPQSLAKHVKICEKMTIKKRKTFDSSRQRREGTDLEQYLPKNFGLPENSPFLEKSPPPTAKPTLKPKPQSVRSAITKPMAELQKCPHCGRAFGVRAFERHVEWCADKAKILPAAPAHPPPHIADAKQRLNARTQYKAPLARGRKTSQSRDKSSNSRSTSVDSSRGVSPPPPRDCGDYGAARSRASESASSNDCHEDAAPHVPVIRTSRGSRTSSSGDAGVRARQARLARDITSSSSSNMMSENLFPSSVKRSTSLLDSIQKKTGKLDATKSRIKTDQLEQDLMQSLKDFDKFYEFEKNEKPKQFAKEVKPSPHLNQKIEKRDHRNKFERKTKKMDVVTNGNYSSNGKTSNDSAYSRLVSLNRISPSKLSICTKDTNGLVSLEQIPAGSDSGGSHKEDARSISSEEFLAMERSTELEDTTPDSRIYKETDAHKLNEKRVCSRNSNTSGRSPTWKPQGQLSSSSSEASLHQARRDSPALAPRLSRFCHECGSKFPVETAKFCIECGVKRLAV